MMVQEVSPESVFLICRHCERVLPHLENNVDQFCCVGCRVAYNLISALGLADFYELRKKENAQTTSLLQDKAIDRDFSVYDIAEYQGDFVERKDDGTCEARIYLGNLNCFACVWLVEKALAALHPDVTVAINYSFKNAKISYDPSRVKLSQVVAAIVKLGFPVYRNTSQLKTTELRGSLIAFAVSVFCTLNTMILAYADYFARDMDQNFFHLFRVLSGLLATLAMVFSARSFFSNALRFALQLKPNIDQPIVFGIGAAFLYSVVNVFRGEGAIYFDTICTITTLLLLGRYLQQSALMRAEARIAASFESINHMVRSVNPDNESVSLVHLTTVCAGMELEVLPGEIIPVQSRVLSSVAEISLEAINGEPEPYAVVRGEWVCAGAVNMAVPLRVQTLEAGSNSFLVKSWNLAQLLNAKKGSMNLLADRLSLALLAALAVTATALLIVFSGPDFSEGMRRAIGAVLIACPCSFGLSVPLAFSLCAAQGLSRGILFKSQRAIEVLSRIKVIFFDKTGTLTMGSLAIERVVDATQLLERPAQRNHLEILRAMSAASLHHMARLVDDWASRLGVVMTSMNLESREVFGQGLVANVAGHQFKLGNPRFCGTEGWERQATCHFTVDGQPQLAFYAGDRLRDSSRGAIADLVKRGITARILSGDSQGNVKDASRAVGIMPHDAFSQLTPDAKLKQVVCADAAAMVGNGINDALALSGSTVGIAVDGAEAYAKESADICLINTGIEALPTALDLARFTMGKVRKSFVFSIVYNGIVLTLAVTGKVTPVAAAIIMPINSVLVTFIATRRWSA